MADFQPAFETTLRWEDPHLSGVVTYDAGGKTRFGLASKYNPDLEAKGFYTLPVEEALPLAVPIYRERYWNWDWIQSQPVANKLFDMGVNLGPGTARMLLNKALATLETPDATFAAINAEDQVKLLALLRDQCATYYTLQAEHNPNLRKYLSGWLRRAAS